jgi:AsmA protein
MTSRKLFIIFAIIIGVLVLLAGGALLLLKILVTPDMIRKNVLPRVEKAVHRRIDMTDVKIRLFSGIALSGLTVYEKDGKGTFVALKEARLHYQLLPLLSRRVVVDKIILDSPDIRIIRNVDGTFNFSDLTSKEKTETPVVREEKTPFTFAVSKIEVSDGRVAYDDKKGISGSPFLYKVQDINIDVKNFTLDHPFTLKLTAAVPGAEVGFDGTIERIKDGPMADGQVTVEVADLTKMVAGLPQAVSAKIIKLSPSGAINAKIHAAGAVKSPIAMLKDGEVQLTDVRLSAGGQNPVLSGTLDISKGSLSSKDFAVALGKNRLNLLFKTSPLDKKPLAVELNASSESLDIDSLASKKTNPSSSASTKSEEGTEPGPIKLPLSVSGAVNVKTATIKGLALSGLSLRYRLADNVLDIQDLRGSTAGGSFLDNSRVNLGVRGFNYSTRLSLQGVRVEKIVDVFAPKAAGSVSGILSAKADISGNGTKSAVMKRNLQGSGSFEIKNGTLTGKGFISELARFLGSEELRIVRFSSFAGTYRIKDSQVHLDSALDGSDLKMKPKGRIGFDKSLDMEIDTLVAPRITGKVARGVVGSFVTNDQGWGEIPLKATGTVGSPHFSLSGKKLEHKIGEKIEETIRKKLEKGTGTEQKPEEQNLEKTIRGIFGR